MQQFVFIISISLISEQLRDKQENNTDTHHGAAKPKPILSNKTRS